MELFIEQKVDHENRPHFSQSPKLSKGQKSARKHVMEGNQTFEVRSRVPELNLKPHDEIQVTNYITVFRK